jgi:hypothetical protein
MFLSPSVVTLLMWAGTYKWNGSYITVYFTTTVFYQPPNVCIKLHVWSRIVSTIWGGFHLKALKVDLFTCGSESCSVHSALYEYARYVGFNSSVCFSLKINSQKPINLWVMCLLLLFLVLLDLTIRAAIYIGTCFYNYYLTMFVNTKYNPRSYNVKCRELLPCSYDPLLIHACAY